MGNPWAPKDWEDFESDSLEASFSQSQPIAPGLVVESAPHTVYEGDSEDPKLDEQTFVPAPITLPVTRQISADIPASVETPPRVFAPVSAAQVTDDKRAAAPMSRSEQLVETVHADSESQSFGSSFTRSASNIVDSEDRDRTLISKSAAARWVLASSTGTSEYFAAGRVIVGRKPAQPSDDSTVSLLVVDDPTRTVSKNHALLEYADGKWWISDLDSTNGIALVGDDGSEIRVARGQRVALTEKCYLGDLLLNLQSAGA